MAQDHSLSQQPGEQFARTALQQQSTGPFYLTQAKMSAANLCTGEKWHMISLALLYFYIILICSSLGRQKQAYFLLSRLLPVHFPASKKDCSVSKGAENTGNGTTVALCHNILQEWEQSHWNRQYYLCCSWRTPLICSGCYHFIGCILLPAPRLHQPSAFLAASKMQVVVGMA